MSVLDQVFALVKPNFPDCQNLSDKKTWNKFLKTGLLPLEPERLQKGLDDVLSLPENVPRGNKLMERRQRSNFTIYQNGDVRRKEEALERLIALSNGKICSNQVPVGGGKESIDLLYEPVRGEGLIVELKPWDTNHSPLYALIESLKNLELCRLIERLGLSKESPLHSVEVAVLAPVAYYESYGFQWSAGRFCGPVLGRMRSLLEALEETFDVRISLFALSYPYSDFRLLCKGLLDPEQSEAQYEVTVEHEPPIPALRRENWIPVGKMIVTIHRGTDEIGGSCVEIAAAGNRIFLDVGAPLDGGPATLPAVIREADAVFISHCHQDHYGLLDDLPPGVEVYMGEVGWSFIRASRVFRKQPPPDVQVSFLKPWEPVSVGSLTITPYLVDHSAPDAYAFLVESEGKRLFYSGDFRGHGRKRILFERLTQYPPQAIDALLIEGTTIGRGKSLLASETDVEDCLVDLLRSESGPAFIVCSAQNIDRLVSAFRASTRAERQLVVDLYTAWIMDQMRKGSSNTPTMEWPEVRVLAHGRLASRQYGIMKSNPDFFGTFLRRVYSSGSALRMKELYENPGRYLIKNGPWQITAMLAEMGCSSASVVFSMWSGYMAASHNTREASIYDELRGRQGVDFSIVHTSGHAGVGDLVRLSDALNAKRVIPIHTERKEEYAKLFRNVMSVADGEAFTI